MWPREAISVHRSRLGTSGPACGNPAPRPLASYSIPRVLVWVAGFSVVTEQALATVPGACACMCVCVCVCKHTCVYVS